jgi:hypothetical protein
MRLRAERRVQKIVTATAIARNGMFATASVLPRKAVSTTNAALTTRSQMTSGWARNRRDTSSANTPPPRALLSESGMAGMGGKPALRLHVRFRAPRHQPIHRSREIDFRRWAAVVAIAFDH